MSYHNPSAKFEKPSLPQRHMPTALGQIFVTEEYDGLGEVTEESLLQIEAALLIVAEHLTDRDVLLSGGINDGMKADAKRDATAFRRVVPILRAIFQGKTIRTVKV